MLRCLNATVRFGANVALSEVTLHVRPEEVVCLLGPSGSGKSTLLRAIAGIERLTSGAIVIDGTEVDGPHGFVEPEHRRVGMVFQDYALFPHLTVEANAAFGLRRGDRALVTPLLERLGLGKYAGRYPHMLSGGEQQRLALARAVAPKPRILLMDEPFSSLDTELRQSVREHMLTFLRETRTTCVIVTHDPDDARQMADRIAVMSAGRLLRYGAPDEVCPPPSAKSDYPAPLTP
jgi:iron(III) transport system ATP-binding protein